MIAKVKKGQKLAISAESWNAIASAVNSGQAGPGLSAGSQQLVGDSDAIIVRNDSGSDCERYDVLGVDDVLITPGENLQAFQQSIALSCVTPVHADHGNRIVVLQEPIASGELGRAALSRPTVVTVDVGNENDMTVGIDDSDSTRLKSGGPIPIVWKEDGTGERWAIVDLGRTVGGGSVSAVKAGMISSAAGEILFDSIRGCRYYDGDLIEDEGGVTQAWDPTDSSQDYEPGIGVAQLWDSASSSVLVIHDATVTEAPIDLYEATPVAVRMDEPVQLEVIGSNPVETVTAYPVRLM